jgi:hypothetical protein
MFILQPNHLIILFYQVDITLNKENVVADDNDAYKSQSLHMSPRLQEGLLSGNKATKSLIKAMQLC